MIFSYFLELYSTVVWFGVVWCGVWFGVGCGVMWYGVVWCVWYGMVWCGVMWCDVM